MIDYKKGLYKTYLWLNCHDYFHQFNRKTKIEICHFAGYNINDQFSMWAFKGTSTLVYCS